MSEDEEKLRKIRGHLGHSHRLNLTEARWLVEELLAAKGRARRLLDELTNARITLAEDKRVMDEMAARLKPPGEHNHEFEDCCVICGITWREEAEA